jgi:adenylate cyclase
MPAGRCERHFARLMNERQMSLTLGQIRGALEGALPAIMATCDADGVPNITFLSQVQYVDEKHVALSYQFFSKTRRNILGNPHSQLTVVHPVTAQIYRMRLRYLHTQSDGPLFEQMRAHLEGIASHTGMAGVFQLRGSDVHEVSELEAVPCATLPLPDAVRNPLAALRRSSEKLTGCSDLGSLLDTLLDMLVQEFGIEHALLLMHDEAGARLYTVGSRGYASSGVGSEITVGDGVIGVCAQTRTAIRINWMTQAYRYSQTIRDSVLQDGMGNALKTAIPYPGLVEPQSQLGVPLLRGTRLLGVLLVESSKELRFTYDDEDALVTLAGQASACIDALREQTDGVVEPIAAALTFTSELPASRKAVQPSAKPALGPTLFVRLYGGTESIFLDDKYLIKGVAGAILWRLLKLYISTNRTEFTNRELRLDPSLRLPDVTDNLEARLLLLRRRLNEQPCGLELQKIGRGQLRLVVSRPIELLEVSDG